MDFLELKKADQMRTVGKLTLKTIKDDPVALERMIRHNREAEINYFVNLVRHKIEKDNDNYLRYTSADLENFENDWFATREEFKNKLLRTSFKAPNMPELDANKKGSKTHDFRSKIVSTLADIQTPKESNIPKMPNTIGEIGKHDLTPKPMVNKRPRQAARGLKEISQAPSERTHYKNPIPYDGQDEITRLQSDYERFLRNDRFPRLVMKPPDGTRVPNSHLSDYYLVRRLPKYFPPTVLVEEISVNSQSGVIEVPAKPDPPEEPSVPIMLTSSSEGEEEEGEGEEEEIDPQTGLKRKKNRVKKKYPSKSGGSKGKVTDYSKPNLTISQKTVTPVDRSYKDFRKYDPNSNDKLTPRKDPVKEKSLSKLLVQKKPVIVAFLDLVQ
jgi:hypothetical protein